MTTPASDASRLLHDVGPVLDYVQGALGVRFDGNRGLYLRAALKDVVRRSGAADAAGYLDLVVRDDSAREDLLSVATVGETHFFRHPQQLEILIERVFPDLAENRPPGQPLRLWSAGCASGEEAYTLAMLAEDQRIPITRILATDVSRTALKKAAAGVYRPWSLRGDLRHLHRFEREGSLFRVPRRLTSRVDFRELNLLSDVYPSGLDLIFCRNVLMYLEGSSIQQVTRGLAAALAEGGWLVTSPADPDVDFCGMLEPVPTRGGVIYRRPGGRQAARSLAPRPPVHDARTTPTAKVSAGANVRSPATPAGALEALEAGHHEAAAAAAETVIANGNGSAAMHGVWARALGNLGRAQGAERVCAAAIETYPLDPELRYLHAEVLIELGQARVAAAQAGAAVYLDPSVAAAHLVLGRAELACDRPEAARRSFRTAADLLAAVPAPPDADAAKRHRYLEPYAAAYETIAARTKQEGRPT